MLCNNSFAFCFFFWGILFDSAIQCQKKQRFNSKASKLKPSSEATGDHSSFKTDGKGKITNTATYKQNPKNPSGFDEVKRVDVTGKKHNGVNTPHVHEPKQRVRPAKPDELPKQK